MKKVLIHTILVEVGSAKLQFQIPLPRNIKRIGSILITGDGVPTGEGEHNEVGWLWLRIPQMRDVFYAEIVRTPLQNYDITSYAPLRHIGFNPFLAWTDGTKEQPFAIEIAKEATVIEGFYSDQFKGSFQGPYTVKIYLNIEL